MPTARSKAGLEIEAKFLIASRSLYKRLLVSDSLAGFTLGPWTVHRDEDSYLDTQELAIRTQGYACRVRRRQGSAVLTLKAFGHRDGAIQHRPEVEVELSHELDPTVVSSWPLGPARDLGCKLVGDRPLRHLLSVYQDRHKCLLLCNDRPVAELSLDVVRFAMGGRALECEVELLPSGTKEELERVVLVLEQDWQLEPVLTSKFERGLDLVERAERARHRKYPGLDPQDTMGEACRKILRLHFERMLAKEPGTRLGTDIEELHDMRVATRRMRAAFRIFAPYFDERITRRYANGLRRIGRALGPVRDLDVFEEKAGAYRSQLNEREIIALDALIDRWRVERSAARNRMNDFLDGGKYARFVERFDRFLATPGLGALPIQVHHPEPNRVEHVAPCLIYGRYEVIRSYEPLLATASVELLHALRIDFKEFRYALEFFTQVLGPEVKGVINEVKVIQDHLGDLNDSVVAINLLTDYLDSWDLDPSGLIAYLNDREEEKQRLLTTFPTAWERFNDPAGRRNLALALSVL